VVRHSGRCNEDVRLYAFDLPADDSVGYARRDAANPQAVARKLLKRSGDGIIYNDHDAGASVLACSSRLLVRPQSIVSKHQDGAYKAGPSRYWIKVKNPNSAAMLRAEDGNW